MEAKDSERSLDLRVGIFVIFGIAVLTLCVFLIGQERRLFEKPVYLKAHFPNVAGLKIGAPVRLAGVDVGIVSAIKFPDLDRKDDIVIIPEGDASALSEGQEFAPEQKEYAQPLQLSLTGRDPADELQATVSVIGTDALERRQREDLRIRVKGFETTVVGKKYFRTLESVTLKKIVNNGEKTQLDLVIGRTKKITVEMRVGSDLTERIRYDSEVRVDSMGLLGDKTIDISIGSRRYPPHKDGDVVRSKEAFSIDDALTSGKSIIADVQASMGDVRSLMSGFVDAGGQETVVAAVGKIRDIATEIESGEGVLHQLLYDKESGQQYKTIVKDVARSTRRVDNLLNEVKSGDGILHEAIYGESGEATMANAAKALSELKTLLKDIRENKGILNQLVYNEDGGETIGNINGATADVRAAAARLDRIVANVEKGQGTIGGLLQDPTVYEDLKTILGNVKRNSALKALVRYSMEREDKVVKEKSR